jgi:hypothetical protein
MTRDEAILQIERYKAKDRKTLERVGLPVIIEKVQEHIYFRDPNNAEYTKEDYVVVDGYYSELRGFTFHKAYQRGYWRIHGAMPMEIAKQLYADPVGKTDIRVAGHCCCPPPDEKPWFSWITPEGKTVMAVEEHQEYASMVERHPDMKESFLKYVPSDDPASIASAFVMSYHIDTELGLRIFVDAVKALKEVYNYAET